MSEFICSKCGKTVKKIEKTVCPFCSGRILVKEHSNQIRELKAD